MFVNIFSTRLFLLTFSALLSGDCAQAAPSKQDLDKYNKFEESASWETNSFLNNKIKEGKDVAEWNEILALHLMRVKADPNVIFMCARTAARAQPKNLHFLVTYALALSRLDKYDAAQQFLDRVLKAEPKNARGLAVQAYIYGEQGKEEALAQELMREALKLAPNDSDVNLYAFHFYKKMFNIDEAMKVRYSWIKNHPKDVNARLHIAEFLKNMRRRDEAIEECKKVLDLSPDCEAAHYCLISTYYDQQDYKATIEAASKYLNKDRMHFGLFELWKRRADSYNRLKQYDKAIADYSVILRIMQPCPDTKFSTDLKNADEKLRRCYMQAWVSRCFVYIDAGNAKRAYDDLALMLRHHPNNPGALQANIRACEQLGKYQQALNSLEILTQKDPDIAEWHKIKIRLLRKAGREADAVAAEKRFKEVTEFGSK